MTPSGMMGFGPTARPQTTQYVVISGGGSGLTGTVRNLSGGAGISGATLERWSSGGIFLSSTTSDGSGNYSFATINTGDLIRCHAPTWDMCAADAGEFTVSGPTMDFLLQTPIAPYKGVKTEGSGITNTTQAQALWTTGNAARSISLLSDGGLMTFPAAGPNGGTVLRYNIPDRSATPPSPCSGSFEYTQALQPRFFPLTLVNNTLWLRLQDNFGVGFKVGRDSCATASSYKKFLIVFENGTSSPTQFSRLGFYFATNGAKTGLDQFHLFCDWPDQTGRGESGGFGSTFVTTFTNTLGGQNNCWVVGITGLGTSGTAFTLYRNGVAVYTRTGMTKLPAFPNLGAGFAVTLENGSNINNGPDQAQTRDIQGWGGYPERPSLLVI